MWTSYGNQQIAFNLQSDSVLRLEYAGGSGPQWGGRTSSRMAMEGCHLLQHVWDRHTHNEEASRNAEAQSRGCMIRQKNRETKYKAKTS